MAKDLESPAETLRKLAAEMRESQIGLIEVKNSVGMAKAFDQIGKFLLAGLQELRYEQNARSRANAKESGAVEAEDGPSPVKNHATRKAKKPS